MSWNPRARPLKRCPIPVFTSRDDEREVEARFARAKALSKTMALGHCEFCGARPKVGRSPEQSHAADCELREEERNEDKDDFADEWEREDMRERGLERP